ncbi:MAG TPA: hypothetical protein VGI52_06010, partial [Solirubrobacteraceae bacterium]
MDIEARRSRREAQQLARRRRRLRAAGGFTALALLALVVVLLLSAGGSGKGSPTGRPAASVAGHAKRSSNEHAARTPGTAVRRSAGAGIATGRPGTEPVPILMYHVIAAPPAGAPFPGLYVAPEEFAAQMQALKRAGWTAVTQDEVEAYWRKGISLPHGKPIVLSFDNGYQSQYTQAMP